MGFLTGKSTISDETTHKYLLESKQLELEAGWLGKIFGTSKAAPQNIAGAVAILLITAGVTTLFFEAKIKPEEFWKIIIPVVSMILGYLFGKKV
ncbi:hypothetical protein [Pseudomonas leptonychotis]|uniref:hypothetical protein n=1 Tax=Pseudomonas leptonychotis TaxID=2448482 RepID=UPI0039F1415A